MNSSSQHSEHPLVPPHEKCIWMTAGLLSYQLCDRQFDCDNCPLDAAMRKQYRSAESQRTARTPGAEAETSHKDLYFSRRHCWVRREAGNICRVGIEAGLAHALMTPKAIAFPALGEQVQKDHICLWIVTSGGTFPLTSPLSGRVWTVNARLTEEPHLIEQQSYDGGWLFEMMVEPNVNVGEELMSPCEAVGKFELDEKTFRDLLSHSLHKMRPIVGPTLADGGVLLQQISDMLGAKKYFSIVCEAFS